MQCWSLKATNEVHVAAVLVRPLPRRKEFGSQENLPLCLMFQLTFLYKSIGLIATVNIQDCCSLGPGNLNVNQPVRQRSLRLQVNAFATAKILLSPLRGKK